jgi:nitrate/nitrite-specific signal transduction histidine kinase
MSERAEKMGGTFKMISAPGEGSEISVEVAVREENMSQRPEEPASLQA